MRHPIDPKVDCVFKALLGAEENRNLLIHFLNAFLVQELVEPLVSVDILNPYNDNEFFSDKLSIVDVKARDSHERLYQIEIQLTNYGHLPARIIYNWADIYSQQLKSGQDYSELKPTYAIWLLAENLLTADNNYVHHYKIRDEQGQNFADHGGIWLLELNKFQSSQIDTEEQRWIKFFREGEKLDDADLPEWMITQEMKQAMTTLSRFSEKERQYFQYQARQDYLRQQRAIELEMKQNSKLLEQNAEELQRNTKELEQTSKALEQTSKELEQTSVELEKTSVELEQTSIELEKKNKALLESKASEELALLEKQNALTEIQHLKALLAKNDF